MSNERLGGESAADVIYLIKDCDGDTVAHAKSGAEAMRTKEKLMATFPQGRPYEFAYAKEEEE